MRFSIDIDRSPVGARAVTLAGLVGAVATEAPRLLSALELADRFGVPSVEVEAWAAEGLLPDPVLVEGRRFWRQLDIELWLTQGRLLLHEKG